MLSTKYFPEDAKRSNFKNRMASAWVRTHRPDVWDVIEDEAYKKFPRKKIRNHHKILKLSKTLEKLK